MPQNSVATVIRELADGRIRVVDLTQTLSPDFPMIELPQEFGQCAPYLSTEVARYDERGPAWYWNNFSCNEHTGTDFDAPVHWISGKDLPNNTVDKLPVEHLVAPACVVDCSSEAAADPDFLLTVDFLQQWEETHGRISPKSWVLMRTDWSKRTDWLAPKIPTKPASTHQARMLPPCGS